MSDRYASPYRTTPGILHSIEQIGEALGRSRLPLDEVALPVLRRGNRIKIIQASLAIEELALMSDQESDHQTDQVKCLVLPKIDMAYNPVG